MDDVGIEYQTVLGYPPVEFVHLAADLGCHAISMKASTGPYNAANPYGYGDFSFLEDVGGRRQMAAALRERDASQRGHDGRRSRPQLRSVRGVRRSGGRPRPADHP